MEEKIKSITLKDKEKGTEYTLDFTRDVVEFAENRGFEIDNVLKFAHTQIRELFWLSFRANHKRMSKADTNAIMDKMGGLPSAMLTRLIELYQQARLSGTINADDSLEDPNGDFSLEM